MGNQIPGLRLQAFHDISAKIPPEIEMKKKYINFPSKLYIILKKFYLYFFTK